HLSESNLAALLPQSAAPRLLSSFAETRVMSDSFIVLSSNRSKALLPMCISASSPTSGRPSSSSVSRERGGPLPHAKARHIPPMKPEGVVSGVLKSPCASIQSIPALPFRRLFIPERLPITREHSPPRT